MYLRILYNLNIFMKGKEIDCHPSPVIHLLLSTTVIHPYPVAIHIMPQSSSGRDPSPAAIHLRAGSISCHPSAVTHPYSVAIHIRPRSISGCNPSLAAIPLWPQSIWLQPFVSTQCVIALVWAAFCHCSCSFVSFLKVIFTDLHNVHLPLTLIAVP